MRELHLYGVSFCTTPPARRDGFRVHQAEATALIRDAVSAHPGLQALLVGDGSRTECWVGLPAGVTLEEGWLRPLARWKPALVASRAGAFCYRMQGGAAAAHFFRRAVGLDLPRLGDPDGAERLARAVTIAGAAGGIGPLLQRLCERSRNLVRQVSGCGFQVGTAGDAGDSPPDVMLMRRSAVARVEGIIATAIEEMDAVAADVAGERLPVAYDRPLRRRRPRRSSLGASR
jgi:hypothetical protein